MTGKRIDKSRGGTRHPSRRGVLLGGVAAASAASWPLILTPGKAKAQAGKLVVATYGGSYAEALKTAYFDPFTKETGIEVVVSPPADLAKLQAQVKTGNVEWDVVETLPTEALTATREGLLEEIDYSMIDTEGLAFADAKKPYTLSVLTYTASIGYHKERHPEGKHPTTWAEFWDVQKFPGRRGLRSRPNDTLELATLAAGVAPKDVYPIDVERAFRKLDEIKPHVANWIAATPQTVSLITQNELDFTNTFSGRVFAEQNAGNPLGYTTDQLMTFLNTFAVAKGARNKEGAFKLLDVMMRPEQQAKLAEIITYGPVKQKAIDMLDPAFVKAWIPDPADPNNLIIQPEWWGEPGRFAELTERFKVWLLT